MVYAVGNQHCAEKESQQYGYRRALVKQPLVVISNKYHNYQDYFQDIGKQAHILRQHLVETGAFISSNAESPEEDRLVREMAIKLAKGETTENAKPTNKELRILNHLDIKTRDIVRNGIVEKAVKMAKKINIKSESVKSKALNIASFGFVFFDNDGFVINPKPFHFSDALSNDSSLEDPFFFLSGRRHRNCQVNDPSCWTALPEQAPKQADLDLRPTLPSFKNLGGAQMAVMNAGNNFKLLVDRALYEKAKCIPFFEYVHKRQTRVIRKEIYQDYLNSLSLPIIPIPFPQEQIASKTPAIYPKVKAEGDNSEEGDFTHGEQYALFQMSRNLEDFLDDCVEQIKKLAPSKTVASYAILIYTYNIMCIRCAQSAIIDFVHTYGDKSPCSRNKKDYEAFNLTINRKLDGLLGTDMLVNPTTRPMFFMAGYTKPYGSKLHNLPRDLFEQWAIDQEATWLQKSGCKDREQLSKAVKIARAAKENNLNLSDITLSQKGYYDFCSPESEPRMIYHVHISTAQNVNQVANSQSITQKNIEENLQDEILDDSFEENKTSSAKHNDMLYKQTIADAQDYSVSTTEYPFEEIEGFIDHLQTIFLETPRNREYTFENKKFIKGKVSPDGTCFIYSLDLLFPDKGINRGEFVKRIKDARNGNNPNIKEEVNLALANELYTSRMNVGGERDFSGQAINKLFSENPSPDLEKIRPQIIENELIINEIIYSLSKKETYFCSPGTELICRLFNLNLDIYKPGAEENSLSLLPPPLRFDGEAIPKAVYFASDHFDPLCDSEDFETRKRFAANEIKVIAEKESFYGLSPLPGIEDKRRSLLSLYKAGKWRITQEVSFK